MRIFTLFLLVASASNLPQLTAKKDNGTLAEDSLISNSEVKKSTHEELRNFQNMDLLLLDFLRDAILSITRKLNHLRFMRSRYITGEGMLKLDCYRFSSDAIQYFKLMKRFFYEWKEVFKIVTSDPVSELRAIYSNKSAKYHFLPESIFKEIVESYLQKQQELQVSARDFADGRYPGAKYETKLSSGDCHDIALFRIHDPAKQLVALEWLREAYVRFDPNTETEPGLQMIVVDLAITLFEAGKTDEAVALAKKYAASATYESYIYIRLLLYLKEKLGNKPIPDIKEGITPDNNESFLEPLLNLDDRLWKMKELCKRTATMSSSHIAKLKCRYATNGSPLFILSPLKEEEVYLEPKISIYRQFLSDKEVDFIIGTAYGKMEKATVQESVSAKSTEDRTSRVSKTYYTKNLTPGLENILKRADAMSGLSKEGVEDLQVAYYDTVGFFAPHFDAYINDYELRNGNRIATVLFYLSNVEVGGETAFVSVDALVEAEKGSALVWFNLKKNGLKDVYSAHGACPVIYGHKWSKCIWTEKVLRH